jgi:hypothetical protein
MHAVGKLGAALAWLAYFPYEYTMRLRMLCSGERNILVDLLLFYPSRTIVPAVAVDAFFQIDLWGKACLTER